MPTMTSTHVARVLGNLFQSLAEEIETASDDTDVVAEIRNYGTLVDDVASALQLSHTERAAVLGRWRGLILDDKRRERGLNARRLA